MINFVNNNISGVGKLFVVLVNVFGSWTGDFVPPGVNKDPAPNSSQPTVIADGSHIGGSVNNDPSNSTSSTTDPLSNNSVAADPLTSVTSTPSNTANTVNGLGRFPKLSGNVLANTIDSQDPCSSGDACAAANNSLTQTTKHITVNLAWLLLALPTLLLSAISKRYLNPTKVA